MQKAANTCVPAAFKLIDTQLAEVRQVIDSLLADSSLSGLNGATGDMLSYLRRQICTGKMLRPGLVLLSHRLISSQRQKKQSQPSTGSYDGSRHSDVLIRAAAVIELIHNATLLHDDVIDGGLQRRQRATINSLWGNESAVLLGDLLLGGVFKMCADLGLELSAVIADCAVRTCEGELRQIARAKDKKVWSLSESEYIDIITEKSAVLFSSSCVVGGLVAGANQRQRQALADFGLNAGIAFQIADDLLDIIGDQDKTGKTLGTDAAKTKLTLAVIHFLKTAENLQKTALIKELSGGHQDKQAFVSMLRSAGSMEYAGRQAEGYADKAVSALGDFEQNEITEAMIDTARFMAQRANIDISET